MQRGFLLNGPLLFDDEALSAWDIDGHAFVASKQSIDAKALKAFAYSASDAAPRRPPEHKADPISVEIVRGANELGDDSWTVLVDGMRCRKRPPILQDGVEVHRCILPPGVVPPATEEEKKNARLTRETKVRPVVVGVRLEAEALQPESVTLFVEQVLDTSEREAQDEDTPEITTIQRVELTPYRVSDLQSKVAVLQYPFCAPAQSVLGILSVDALKRWEGDNRLRMAWDLAAPLVTAAQNVAYESRKRTTNVGINRAARLFVDPRTQALRKLTKPKKPSAMRTKNIPAPPDEKSSQTFRIGGGSKSSAKELGELFAILTQVCKAARKAGLEHVAKILEYERKERERAQELAQEEYDLNNVILSSAPGASSVSGGATDTGPKPTAPKVADIGAIPTGPNELTDVRKLQEILRVMEQGLINNGEYKALALLRALCTTRIKEELRVLLRSDLNYGNTAPIFRWNIDDSFQFHYSFEDNGNIGAVPKPGVAQALDQTARSKLFIEMTKEYSSAAMSKDAPYAFTYQRLLLPVRRRTTVSTRFRVQITGFRHVHNSTEQVVDEFEFVADQEDALVAHAVYSGVVEDVEYMDIEALRFLDCLLGPYAGTKPRVPESNDDDFGDFDPAVLKVVMSKNVDVEWKDEAKVPTQTTGVSSGPLGASSSNVPNVVIPGTKGTEASITKTREIGARTVIQEFSEGNQQKNVAHIETRVAELRIMIREILPTWPDTDLVKTEEEAIAYYKQSQDPSAASGASSTVQDKGAASGDDTSDSEEDVSLIQKNKEDELKEIENAIAETDKDDSYSVVFASPETSKVLSRRLPHIVSPKVKVVFPFKVPDSVNPPGRFIPWQDEGQLTWKEFAGLSGGFLALVAVLVYQVSVQLAMDQTNSASDWVGSILTSTLSALSSLSSTSADTAAANLFTKLLEAYQKSEVAQWMSTFRALTNLYGGVDAARKFILKARDRRIEADGNLKAANREHAKKEMGIPVDDAFASARQSVKNWKAAEKKRIGIYEDAHVVYNIETGKRFHFKEFYSGESFSHDEYMPVHEPQHWDLVGNEMLYVSTPMGVSEALFEAQELRGVPISDTVSFTTGKGDTTTTELLLDDTASNAFNTLAQDVVHAMKVAHNGERLMASPAEMCMRIVEGAVELLKCAYGDAKGTKLVTADDVVWQCAKCGLFARFSIRYLSLFLACPVFKEDTGTDFVNKSLEFWSKRRRSVVNAFCNVLLSEAKSYAKIDQAKLYAQNQSNNTSEVFKLLSRVYALSAAKVSQPEMGKLLTVLQPRGVDIPVDSIYESYESAQEQANLNARLLEVKNEVAVWASRRMNTRLSRGLTIGSGAESVLTSLAAIDISDDKQSGWPQEAIFYCPVGSRLDSLPGNRAFVSQSMNQRVIWMDALQDAAETLLGVCQEPSDTEGQWTIEARPLTKRTGMLGVARHPVAIVAKGRKIDVGLAENVDFADVNDLSQKIMMMRKRAYNADRLFFAISLAYSTLEVGNTLHVNLPQDDVLCMAIALAMRHVEGGSRSILLILHVASPLDAQKSLEGVISQVNTARSLGCRVCSLGELAFCL